MFSPFKWALNTVLWCGLGREHFWNNRDTLNSLYPAFYCSQKQHSFSTFGLPVLWIPLLCYLLDYSFGKNILYYQ